MTVNPYLTPDNKTTFFGATGEVLVALGLVLPPPFNFVAYGLGAASRITAFYLAKDRDKLR